MEFRASPGRYHYGSAIGILMMDAVIPRPPGDVGNASTFDFPVLYKRVVGASLKKLINDGDPELLSPFIEAGIDLAEQGVKAITTTCGFMVRFQGQMAASMPVPFFGSSLLQLPLIQASLGPQGKVGIITADADSLSSGLLELAGGDPDRIVVAGMQGKDGFRRAILEGTGRLDFEEVRDEAVETALGLKAMNPTMGALLLECANLPPYAKAIQDALGLPIYDFNTMIGTMYSALTRSSYTGLF